MHDNLITLLCKYFKDQRYIVSSIISTHFFASCHKVASDEIQSTEK